MSPGHLGMGSEDAEGRPYASAADVPVSRAQGGGDAVARHLGGGSTAGGGEGVYRHPASLTGSAGGAGGTVAQKWCISVYIDDGVVYDYEVESMHAAREHASAIVTTGYRSVQFTAPDTLTHYPPHRITKVKIKSPTSIQTGYFDRVRGT